MAQPGQDPDDLEEVEDVEGEELGAAEGGVRPHGRRDPGSVPAALLVCSPL
jgi:hypothetical protein